MFSNNPVYFRLLNIIPQDVNGMDLRVIPDGMFSKEEIECLRKIEEWTISIGEEPLVANFLPDANRPEWVKKL